MPRDDHRLLTVVRAVLLAGLLLLPAACGGGDGDSDAGAAPVVVTPSAALPCSAAGGGLALPSGWPSGVPLPQGLVITRTEQRSGERRIVTGRVAGDFHPVVDFFNRALPAAGYTQAHGEIDPHDAESDFTGSTTKGRWTAGGSPDCPGATQVTVLAVPVGGDLGADQGKDG